jgi:hypothetical protein
MRLYRWNDLYMKVAHLLFFLILFSCGNSTDQIVEKKIDHQRITLPIQWVDDLEGDFSFKDKWDYPIGVYKNDHGQLSCDGWCPPETDKMKDEYGRIYKKYLEEFYKLVDTTHQFHTLSGQAATWEYGEANFMHIRQLSDDSFNCWSMCDPGTHCSLHLILTKDSCFPFIDLNSVAPNGDATFYSSGGSIKIDRSFWKKGVFKAEFDLNFLDPGKLEYKMYWRGEIFAPIEKK